MVIKNACHVAIAIVLLCVGPVSAELLLDENWESETEGDKIAQLEQWYARGGSGEIMMKDGNKFLQLSNPDPKNFSWITSKHNYSFAGGNELSLAVEFTLRGDANADASAKLGIRRAVYPNHRYNLDIFPNSVRLSALGEGQSGLLGSSDVSVGVDQQHTILWTTTHHGNSIGFDVFLDGEFLFSATDSTPFLNQDVDNRFVAQLVASKGMSADFDNIQFRQVPEPSSLFLFGFAGIALCVAVRSSLSRATR